MREGIALLQKVFQIRTCEDTVFANRSRPCMLHQIQRCTAPCVGLVSPEEYRDDVQAAVLFLQGKTDEVRGQLQAQMDEAAAALAFERAARIRDKITRLNQLQSRQFVESATAGDVDVVAAVTEGGLVAVNVVMIRGGRHVGDRTFFPHQAEGAALPEVVQAFLAQHYVERPVPPTIVVPGADDQDALAEVLSAQSARRVEIVGTPGGERRVWLAMATENAMFAIRRKLAQKATQEDRLATLQAALGLPPTAQRIECFDVSHTMGERAVASCVVFDRLAMQSGEYRRFNVTPPAGGDDYAAMREALSRRVARIVAGEYPGAGPAGDRRRPWPGRRGRGGAGRAGTALDGADRHRQGPGAQSRAGGDRVSGPARAAAPARGQRGPAPAAADPRRGPSLRDPGPPRTPRQGAHDVVAAGDRRNRRGQAQGAPRALRWVEGRAGGLGRRPRARARHFARAGTTHLRGAALMDPIDPVRGDDADPVPHSSPVVRWLLLLVGLVAVALGVVGAFLPVLPTTPFLLVGAACFARASPRLHRRLAASKTFGPTLVEWRRHRAIAWRTKRYALVLIGLSIGVSAIFFVEPWWGRAGLVALGVAVGAWLWSIPSRDRPASANAGGSQARR